MCIIHSVNIYRAPTMLQVLTTCACVLSCFSCVQLFATLWTVAHQASLALGILQASILKWVAMPSSRAHNTAIYKTPPPPLSLVLICISKFTYAVKIIFSQQCLDNWCSVKEIAESVVEDLPWDGETFQGSKIVLSLHVCLWMMTTRIPSENT